MKNVISNPDDAAIVSATIAMAKQMELKTVTEGIETREQLAFLKNQKGEKAQGYLFSKPVPAKALEKLLRQKKNYLK